MFLLNSQIPLVRFSSELTDFYARHTSQSLISKHPSPQRLRPSSLRMKVEVQCSAPIHPVLRANPFTKDTDLFCRIPLSTLFYRPEAVNLGDLMRLWVRSGVKRARRQIFKGRHERT